MVSQTLADLGGKDPSGYLRQDRMSGDTEIDDPEVSDGASENEYSDHDEHDVVGKDEDDNTDMAEQKFQTDENGKAVGSSVTTKPKLDPKDPLRPRRKKARRACFACQRAHLTCGMSTPLEEAATCSQI